MDDPGESLDKLFNIERADGVPQVAMFSRIKKLGSEMLVSMVVGADDAVSIVSGAWWCSVCITKSRTNDDKFRRSIERLHAHI